jgi:hypothetical protein
MATIIQENRVAQEPFELVLRLQQSRSGQPSDNPTGLRLRAQAVVKDLLMSRLEIDATVTAQEYVHIHGFCDLGKALGASRAVQLAFEGFCSAVPNGANVSMVLDSSPPEDAFFVDPGPSVEQKDLLASAKPFQVLVTQAFYNKLQHHQPVAVRSFPARSGVYEFLWTSEERLAELQNQDEFMPTLVIPARPSPAPVNNINDQTFFMDPDDRPAAETLPPVLRDEPPTDDRKSGQRPRRKMVIAIACAAVILIVLGCLGFANPSLVNRLKGSVLAYFPQDSAPPARPAPSTTHPPGPIATAISPPPQQAFPPGPVPVPPSPKPNPPPAPRAHACSMETNLIPGYLELAQSNLNTGKYNDAIRQFQRLLGCESVSRQAREGLQTAKKAQQANGTGQQSR